MSREKRTASPDHDSALAKARKAIADKLSLAGAAAVTSGMATVVAHSLLAVASPSSFTDAGLTQFLSSLSANWLSQIVWNLRRRMERRALSRDDGRETIRQLSGDVMPQLSDRGLAEVLARLGVIETTLRAAEARKVDAGALTREMLRAGIATKEAIQAVVERFKPGPDAHTQITTAINSTIITFVGNYNTVILGETEAQLREAALLEEVKTHMRQLVWRHRLLDLRGFDFAAQASAAGSRIEFELEKVFTPLSTRQSYRGRADESEPIRVSEGMADRERPDRTPIVEALNDAPRVVILGKAGSGKSTVLKHVLLGLCGEAAEFDHEWRHGSLLPIWVTLREFVDDARARSSGPCDNAEQRAEQTRFKQWISDDPVEALIEFVIGDLKRGDGRRKQALPTLAQNLETWLKERGGVFLLDGLDEVPSAQRRMVRQAIEGLAERFPRCRLIVACRPYSYRDEQDAAKDRALKIAPGGKLFVELDVLPLDLAQIGVFVQYWYSHLANRMPDLSIEVATRRTGELVTQIEHDARLRALAETPLLLTLIGSLHGLGHRRLPNERWELLKQTVDLLLLSWQRRKRPADSLPQFEQPEGLIHDALERQPGAKLLTKLCELAYVVHAGAATVDQSAASVITESQLMAALRDVLPRETATDEALAQYLRDRAGLILDEGGKDGQDHVYRFPHRMFQEYLCACHMVNSYGKVARMIDGDYERWQEVYALLALMSENAVFTMTCVERLWPLPPASAADWRRVELGVGIWADFPPHKLDSLLKDADNDVTLHIENRSAWLSARMSDVNGAHAPERARAGDALARLGDPRFDPEHWFLPKGDWLGFTSIEADPKFKIGTREGDRLRIMEVVGGDEDSIRREINDEPTPTCAFYIARFPVTVAQFRAFVDAAKRQSGNENALRDPDTRPVRWVNWHEALDYCAWLETQLKGDTAPAPLRDLLRTGQWRLTLPSELEWEKAARGGLKDAIFSWKGGPNPAMANYADTRIGTTSSVGCFPSNGYVLHDMIGNMWEWTRSEYGSYSLDRAVEPRALDPASDEPRVLRGGAFSIHQWGARCAYRHFSQPDRRSDLFGFRVVLSPS